MTLTSLDKRTALIVVDLQAGIVALPTTHPAADIVEVSRNLARLFRSRKLPVVLVNVAGGPAGRTDSGTSNFNPPAEWIELIPEIERDPSDHVITKKQWGAFHNTQLNGLLRDEGATQVVIIDIATSIGVESTAREAYDLGYNVTIVSDAVTDLSEDAHNHSMSVIFPRISEVVTSQEVELFLRAP